MEDPRGFKKTSPIPFLLLCLMVFSPLCCRSWKKSPALEAENKEGISPSPLSLVPVGDLDFHPKPFLHPLALSQLSITGLRVGVKDYLRLETPVLQWHLPEGADFTQILRCPENTLIFGGEDTLNGAQFRAKTGAEEASFFQRNRFWADARSKCTLLGDPVFGESYEDLSCPTGNHLYYARPCIHPQRFLGKADPLSPPCSPFIAVSNTLSFSCTRSPAEELQAHKVEETRSFLALLQQELSQSIRELRTNLLECQTKRGKALMQEEQKKSIQSVTSVLAGVGLSGSFLGTYAYDKWTRSSPWTLKEAHLRAWTVGGLFNAGYQIVKNLNDIAQPIYADDLAESPLCKDPAYMASLKEMENANKDGAGKDTDFAKTCSCTSALYTQQEIQNHARNIQQAIQRLEEVPPSAPSPSPSSPASPSPPNQPATGAGVL